MNCSIIQEIINVFKQGDLFNAALNSTDGLLRSQHKRKCFYTENFRYIEPLEKKLGENKYGRPSVYHYIPVHKTLQSLLQDQSLIQCVNSPHCGDRDMFTDLHDGHVYKQIQQTADQLPFLEVVLYQDAFDVVNPIGAARKMHKIVAFYMTLANSPVHLRMNIDNLQLVLLCREFMFIFTFHSILKHYSD